MDIDKITITINYKNERENTNFNGWLLNVEKLAKDGDLPSLLSDQSFLCKTFYSLRKSGITRQHYQKIKRYIHDLCKYYSVNSEVPTQEDVLKSREVVCFYKDLDSLLKFIDRIGDASLMNYDKLGDLLNIKAIAILGWYGLSSAQSALVLSESIKKIGDKCYINDVEIDEEPYMLLRRLITAEGYRGLPVGRKQVFKGYSKYLFRSTITNAKVKESNLINWLKTFNVAASGFSHAIIFRNLKKNALFVKIRNDGEQSLSKKIAHYFRCEERAVYSIKKEYAYWENMYYN